MLLIFNTCFLLFFKWFYMVDAHYCHIEEVPSVYFYFFIVYFILVTLNCIKISTFVLI